MPNVDDTLTLESLEEQLTEIAEVAYRADRKSVESSSAITDYKKELGTSLTASGARVAAIERSIADIDARLNENTDVDKEQRRSLQVLQGEIEKLHYEIKTFHQRLSPETGDSYEKQMALLEELNELLSGDSDDDTVPSYRKFRADAVSVFRSVLGDGKTIKSLDVFRSEYYASLNQREGLSSFIGKVGPYLGAIAASVLGWMFIDRIALIESAQGQLQARVSQIEYRVGDGNNQGTMGEDLENQWEYVNELEASFRQLKIDLLLLNQRSINELNENFAD